MMRSTESRCVEVFELQKEATAVWGFFVKRTNIQNSESANHGTDGGKEKN